MPTILAGIDEAGYGPTLGPLVVGLAVFELSDPDDTLQSPKQTSTQAEANAKVPDLWKLLAAGVCREPGRSGGRDKVGRIAIADSKRLKLPNSSERAHPLVHLERGVLSMLTASGGETASVPASDIELFERLGINLPAHAAYEGDPIPLPVAVSPGDIGISVNVVRRACAAGGVCVRTLRAKMIGEAQFNAIVERTQNKSETTATAVGEHLRFVAEHFAPHPPAASGEGGRKARLGIVCDRLGGRTSYERLLTRECRGLAVEVVEETDLKSRYIVSDGEGRRAGVSFMVEGEQHHMAVALASMVAKYCRELSMMRFNRYFAAQHRDLTGLDIRPTAGYALDARRWLEEIGETMVAADRHELVRRA